MTNAGKDSMVDGNFWPKNIAVEEALSCTLMSLDIPLSLCLEALENSADGLPSYAKGQGRSPKIYSSWRKYQHHVGKPGYWANSENQHGRE